ncbi:uncharacterized protein LOC118412665 [Branchiostoma floridae]|uniref:Uncharacterized protein LOC118412665 n=1 Tax=Branchiostoma floridae TaxID=7739 RepID=A0A9J7KW50_BRAFL|nr:uncharacterized protein LOC118412665 [Branchiostoma floridae]
MVDVYEEAWVPPDTAPGTKGNYEQACDVRLAFKPENGNQRKQRDSFSAAKLRSTEGADSRAGGSDGNTQVNEIYGVCNTDHTIDSTDTEDMADSVPGRPSSKRRRPGCWILAAIGLCALVGLTVVAMAQYHRAADSTEPLLESINKQLEVNGKALQDVLLTLKMGKLRGDMPGPYVTVPEASRINDTGATHMEHTDHQPLTTSMTSNEGDTPTIASVPGTGELLPAVDGYSVRQGSCPGNDIPSISEDGTTLEDCAERCTNHPGCVAFTFTDNHRCFPKTKTCTKMRKTPVMNMFYDKKSDGPRVVNGYTVRQGYCSSFGDNLGSISGTGITLQDCAQHCDTRPDCAAFTVITNKTCSPMSKPCADPTNPTSLFYEKETVCKIKATNNIYRYRWDLPPLTTSPFRFDVKASHDIHIALAQDMNQMYEIVIGGWRNQKSVIRREKQGQIKVKARTPGIASPALFQTFSIQWAADGTISVSKVPGTAPFMSWRDPAPLPIHHVGYTTGFGASDAVWKFCSNNPSGRQPKGLWPMTFESGPRDMTGNGNDGRAIGVFPAPGPNNQIFGSYRFTGRRMSRMLIPYKSVLDIQYSLTILVYVRASVTALPLHDFMGDSWGLMEAWKRTMATPADRTGATDQSAWGQQPSGDRFWPHNKGRTQPADINAPHLVLNKWTYVGISYNYSSGEVALWMDNIKVAQKLIGITEHRARFPLLVGYNGKVSKPFSGQLSCLQVYDYALTQKQITAAMHKCQVNEIVCDPSWHRHGSRCFRIFSVAVPYAEAKAVCARHNSRVALPKDLPTNNFLVQLRNKVNKTLPTWIGLRDKEEEGKHVWEDGEELGRFRAWGPGEPNNQPGDSDCVRIEKATGFIGANKWRDFPCTLGTFGVICEKGQTTACPIGWTKLDPDCFMHIDKPATFEDAENVCKNMGASLHTAADEEGLRTIQGLAKTGKSRWVWTGREKQDIPSSRCRSFLIPQSTGRENAYHRPYHNMQGPCTRKLGFICKKG